MIMVADALRLTLFPAMMAFAASSDLLTMTISNRVSLILVGGFAALAAIGGVSAADLLSHLAAGCVVLVARSEEHTSELQSLRHLVCRLLLEKKKPVSHIDL